MQATSVEEDIKGSTTKGLCLGPTRPAYCSILHWLICDLLGSELMFPPPPVRSCCWVVSPWHGIGPAHAKIFFYFLQFSVGPSPVKVLYFGQL